MAIAADEVRVAGAGHVFVAPEGTAAPVDLAALPADWVDIGYVTTDGVTFTFSRETEDLDAWQGDKIRVLTTRYPATVGFSLMQTSSDVIVLAMGGGSVTEVSTGVYKYLPSTDNAVRSFVVEFDDEGKKYRYYVPRSQVEGDVAFTLTRAGAVTYPLTFGLLDNDPKYVILSNDEAMGDGNLPGTIGGGAPVVTPLATLASTAPAVGSQDSLWIDSDDGVVQISNGVAWVAGGVTLAAVPAAVSIGTADPTTGAGVAGAEDDAYFQNTGTEYAVWIKGAGAATDWTDSGDTIGLT